MQETNQIVLSLCVVCFVVVTSSSVTMRACSRVRVATTTHFHTVKMCITCAHIHTRCAPHINSNRAPIIKKRGVCLMMMFMMMMPPRRRCRNNACVVRVVRLVMPHTSDVAHERGAGQKGGNGISSEVGQRV